jgi:hypothetical protein
MTTVHISKMTGKLEGFRAISTNTVTNSFCQKMNTSGDTICRLCYSHEMLNSYRKNIQPSLQRNSDLLSGRVLDQTELPTILDAFFRINAHGELINATHLETYAVGSQSTILTAMLPSGPNAKISYRVCLPIGPSLAISS